MNCMHVVRLVLAGSIAAAGAVAQAPDSAKSAHGQNTAEPPAVAADTTGRMGLPTAQMADAELEERVRAVAKQLRCPVCQGESIHDSPSSLAQEMKAVVREQLAAGRTPTEVKEFFVARYGEWILLQPPARGLNTMLYALPVIVVIAGLVTIAVAVKRWRPAIGRSA